jgi:putative NADH-flavin reductase
MNVLLYGATGNAGSRILAELLSRGHHVTAVVRPGGRTPPAADNLTLRHGNLDDENSILHAIQATNADAIVSAYAAPFSDVDQLASVTSRLIAATAQAAAGQTKAPRLFVVGGAGSLEAAPGVPLIDAPDFPPAWKPIAAAHGKALDALRKSSIDWTYLSPSALFEPGQRTGNFRLAQDTLLADSAGNSSISMEDYAIALVDELEQPQHRRQRFTVGY